MIEAWSMPRSEKLQVKECDFTVVGQETIWEYLIRKWQLYSVCLLPILEADQTVSLFARWDNARRNDGWNCRQNVFISRGETNNKARNIRRGVVRTKEEILWKGGNEKVLSHGGKRKREEGNKAMKAKSDDEKKPIENNRCDQINDVDVFFL